MKKRIAVLLSAFAITVLLNSLSVFADVNSTDPNAEGSIAISPMCILDDIAECE